MKFKLIIALFIICLPLIGKSQGAAIKIGYTDVEGILSQLPQYKTIEADLKTYNTQLQNQLQSKVKELENKYADFERGQATMTEVVKNDKMKELQNLQNSIQEFEKNAAESLQKKQVSLLQPEFDKIQKAITEVAKENNYNYILSSGVGEVSFILYASENDDVTNLVLKKLGVNPAATNTTNTNTNTTKTTPK